MNSEQVKKEWDYQLFLLDQKRKQQDKEQLKVLQKSKLKKLFT